MTTSDSPAKKLDDLDLSFIDSYIESFPSFKNTDELLQNQKDILLDLLYSINKSIIEGIYIKDTLIYSVYVTKLEELSDATQDFTKIPEAKLNHNKYFFEFFEYVVNIFRLFVEKTNRLYSKETPTFINITILFNTRSSHFQQYDTLIQLLKYNIELSKIDHLFVNEEKVIKELFNHKNDIINLRIDSLLIPNSDLKTKFTNLKNALLIKVNFLIDKWTARQINQLKKADEKHSKLFSNSDITLYSNTELSNYILKINYIYDEDTQTLRDEYKKILSKHNKDNNFIDQLTYFNLHTLIKYYKDYTKDIDKLKNLITFFYNKEATNLEDNIHENFAVHISKQYCLNNYFSLFCDKFIESSDGSENIKDSLSKLSNEYDKVKNDSTYLTDNFFLDAKFLNTSLLYLKKNFENNKNTPYDIIKDTAHFFNKKLKKTISLFDKKVQWSIKNNNYIFKLPYIESLITFNDLKIYLSSSFLLPKLNDEILEAKNQISLNYQTLSLKYSTETEIKDIKELKEEYKADNKRTIEIVTLFTAVISFIVGSIGGFKFITDIYSAISFVSIFGLCLLCFVLIIMRLLRKDGLGSFWDFAFLLLLLMFIAFISLNMQKTLKPDVNTTNTESTNTIKLKIDN